MENRAGNAACQEMRHGSDIYPRLYLHDPTTNTQKYTPPVPPPSKSQSQSSWYSTLNSHTHACIFSIAFVSLEDPSQYNPPLLYHFRFLLPLASTLPKFLLFASVMIRTFITEGSEVLPCCWVVITEIVYSCNYSFLSLVIYQHKWKLQLQAQQKTLTYMNQNFYFWKILRLCAGKHKCRKRFTESDDSRGHALFSEPCIVTTGVIISYIDWLLNSHRACPKENAHTFLGIFVRLVTYPSF